MLIKVKVFPDSKKAGITEKGAGRFEVRLKEKAERGLANGALIKALSLHFRIPSARIRLLRGFKQRNKTVEIIL